MRCIVWFLIALASCAAQPVYAQVTHYLAPRYIDIEWAPEVRDSLARAWNDSTPSQVERGYCLAYKATLDTAVMTVNITALVPPAVFGATPYKIVWECPVGTIPLHTHTPTTCGADEKSNCVLGGRDAWVCGPSSKDTEYLRYYKSQIGFIQCDRHAIVMYFANTTPHD